MRPVNAHRQLYYEMSNPPRVLQFKTLTLGALYPVLNGTVLTEAQQTRTRADLNEIEISYTCPAFRQGTFRLVLKHQNDSSHTIRYWLENFPDDFLLDSFGIHLSNIENARAFLRNGYFSWDGSEYIECDAPREVTGYAVTQLLPRDAAGSVVIGFDRHDRFQHTFTLSTGASTSSLTIQTLWDRKTRQSTLCESERLVLFEHPQVEDALREWARLVAAQSPVPPRHAGRITGWCSWYNLYAYITEENILEHLRGVQAISQRDHLPMRVFQMDDGFTPEMGDWLDVKPQFPRGIKPLLDDIRRAGFVPGLWIAPFMVGNRSRLLHEHPDWVVRERATGQPLAQMKFYDEFRWHKRSEEYYILDTTHPDALEYLRTVFRTWRREWGCDYFKTDFMQFASEHGPDRALFHTPGMTRIEIWRRVAAMIREELGEALWLGCGCPLWASVGLVDAVRIGRDVGVAWSGERASGSLLRDGATRNFANGILWQADPDCILLRDRFHYLNDVQVQSLALFGGLLGGVLTTSDNLQELSPERLATWEFLLRTTISSCHFPLLGQPSDGALVQVCRGPNVNAVFVLNTTETPITRQYTWDALGLPQRSSQHEDSLACALEAHEGKLFLLGESSKPDNKLLY